MPRQFRFMMTIIKTTNKQWAVSMAGVAKGIATLVVLGVTLPFSLAAFLGARAAVRYHPPSTAPQSRTIMISGGKMTKALQLARSFHGAGHRVILTETHAYRLTGHRFSKAVSGFHITPEPSDPGYIDALRQIVLTEQVNVYVPVCSPVSSVPDAVAKTALADLCEVIHGDVDVIRQLDDKTAFSALALELGLSVPAFLRITHADQVKDFDFEKDRRRYILKSVAYDPVRRLDLTPLPRETAEETAAFVDALPISETNPWILQEFIEGEEYCTHSTVRSGRITLHACCRSSASQLNYEQVDKPAMSAWADRLVNALKITGQVSLDFIETAQGQIYAIECNPRTHSAITMFYNHPGVSQAYLDDDAALIEPLSTSRPTYWFFHELFEGLTKPWTIGARARTIARGKEAIFEPADPLPVLIAHHLQIPLLLLRALRRMTPWVKIDFNIGKLVMLAGD